MSQQTPTAAHELTLKQAAALMQKRALSPVEYLETLLARTARIEPLISGYITLMSDQALQTAIAAESEMASGRYRGPLHGIPVAVKDLLYAVGAPTTAGSPTLASYQPDHDSGVVERLKAAGAVIPGKSNLPEFAYTLPPRDDPPFPTPSNPWDVERTAGGSSSGSAVLLAAGLVPGAIGSDSGGSIRIPSHLCGVVGLKPTHGRVTTHGAIALSPSLDHVGPMARTAEDAALILNAIAGHDPRDPLSSERPVPDFTSDLDEGVRGVRIGVIREYMRDPIDPEVHEAVERALNLLEESGAKVREVEFPLTSEVVHPSPILLGEAAAYHLPALRRYYDRYSEIVRRKLLLGLAVSGPMYLQSQRVRDLMISRTRRLLEEVDVLVCPTMPIPAARHDEDTVTINGHELSVGGSIIRYTRIYNVTGFPAISVPCGFNKLGMPVGMQIGGRPWDESTVLRVAHTYQQLTPWHTHRPQITAPEGNLSTREGTQ